MTPGETVSSSGMTAPPDRTVADDDPYHSITGPWLALDMQGDFSPLDPAYILALLEFSLKSSKLNEATALRGGEISLCLLDDEQIAVLNADWRGKNSPTNVLSFPGFDIQALNDMSSTRDAYPDLHLGDIILSRETVTREAESAGKKYQDHMAHLIVHGFLHIIGYDHIEDSEAGIMERLEIDILQAFNISNPYQ